ncbi:MAG TPA: NAD(P)H-dependent oxidoreductase, partial [bacterium]|nr:NAD(P)H-dependent oxidoreductase [bacterium]
MRVLGVYGSLRPASLTGTLVDYALTAAGQRGAEVRKCDLRELSLPMFEDDADYASDAVHQQVTELVRWADGFLVGSPEYHGSMSG